LVGGVIALVGEALAFLNGPFALLEASLTLREAFSPTFRLGGRISLSHEFEF
jgi:hypothetical protein